MVKLSGVIIKTCKQTNRQQDFWRNFKHFEYRYISDNNMCRKYNLNLSETLQNSSKSHNGRQKEFVIC